MSYVDQTRRNHPATIAAVAILHAGLGYAIITGLGYTVIPFTPGVIVARNYEDPPPPPVKSERPPPRTTQNPLPTQSDRVVDLPRGLLTQTIETWPLDPPSKPDIDLRPRTEPPPPPPQNLARAVAPAAGRATWVTADDYPPQALREGVSGSVGISVLVGADGRVQACEVTGSSGNAQLDDATCRTYARRARFRPALDADGKPVAARHVDRVRWQVPN